MNRNFPFTSVILLAGGTGSRMSTQTPKQFLPLKGKMIAHYSLEIFIELPAFKEMIIVSHEQFQPFFEHFSSKIIFAKPGARRQDSVRNGLDKVSPQSEFVCIHDSARPLITKSQVMQTLEAAYTFGAASLAVPLKFTIKQATSEGFVLNTPDRTQFWEIQTPQIIRKDWLKEGFETAYSHHLTLTDDVSFVEILNYPVKLIPSSYDNIKITTQEDLALAEILLNKRISNSYDK